MKVYSYVIVADDGGAPNFEGPQTTLALCKPQIRLRANLGDLIIGFTGKKLGPEPHAVRWAGIIAEKMTFSDYWNDQRFFCKRPNVARMPDNIYRLNGNTYEIIENEKHSPSDMSRDLSGGYVLVFDPSWYFGAFIELLPEEFGARLTGGRRGYRVKEIETETMANIRNWLDSHCQNNK